MDGRRSASHRLRRDRSPAESAASWGLAALFALVGTTGMTADETSTLRPLVRRFASPSRLFEPGETDVDIRRVAVPSNKPLAPLDLKTATARETPPSASRASTSVAHGKPTHDQPARVTPSEPAAMVRLEAPPAPAAEPAAVSALFRTTPDPLRIDSLLLAAGTAQPPPPAPPADGSTPAPSGNSGSIAEAEKLGDAPPSNTLQFLRRQAVLLEPGQWQFDYGLTYAVLDSRFVIPFIDNNGNVVDVASVRARQRLLTVPFAFRYGVTEDLQAFINAPVGWSNTELSFANFAAGKHKADGYNASIAGKLEVEGRHSSLKVIGAGGFSGAHAR